MSRQHVLTLPANPRAVKLAREWVGRVVHDIGRADLVPSAELAVSELVTNAIMHSTPPVAVRVRGTRAHPRIEVADRSLVPPRPTDLEPGEDEPLQTFGRGLGLVAVHSAAWGSDIDPDGHGKTVWFEPVAEPDPDSVPIGDLFDLDEVIARRIGGVEPPVTVELRLLGTPVTAYVEMRRTYHELCRELRLIALANPSRYPLAVKFSDVALQAEQERRQSTGFEEHLPSIEHGGAEQVDLVGQVPCTAAETMGRLRCLLGDVLDFYEVESLLTARPTARQLEVQHWYLDEYVRQGAGDAPRPWSGGYDDRAQQSAS